MSQVAVKPFSFRLKCFLAFALLLMGCFAKPLFDLVRFALHNDLYSHVLLVPFISGYLVWLKRQELELDSRPAGLGALAPFVLGLALVGAYWLATRAGWRPAIEDYLAIMTLGFV